MKPCSSRQFLLLSGCGANCAVDGMDIQTPGGAGSRGRGGRRCGVVGAGSRDRHRRVGGGGAVAGSGGGGAAVGGNLYGARLVRAPSVCITASLSLVGGACGMYCKLIDQAIQPIRLGRSQWIPSNAVLAKSFTAPMRLKLIEIDSTSNNVLRLVPLDDHHQCCFVYHISYIVVLCIWVGSLICMLWAV